jgi:hypothetical protein
MSENEKEKGCSCCSGDSRSVLFPNGQEAATSRGEVQGMKRSDFLRILGAGVVGLSCIAGTQAFAAAEKSSKAQIVKGASDRMIVDNELRELRISATVTKDASQPSVADWGRRFQAFFGAKGGKMEPYFVFTTDVSRVDIDKAIRELGIRSRRQIPMSEVAQRTGLKATTVREDYLDGDPMICTIRFQEGKEIVEAAIEDFIDEKIMVDDKEVFKPYTPHFIYHGTAEAINFPSGCILCPSDCNGGIITDNVLPLKTTVNYYKVNWNRMPPVGSKVEVVLKSIYGPYMMSSTKG